MKGIYTRVPRVEFKGFISLDLSVSLSAETGLIALCRSIDRLGGEIMSSVEDQSQCVTLRIVLALTAEMENGIAWMRQALR